MISITRIVTDENAKLTLMDLQVGDVFMFLDGRYQGDLGVVANHGMARTLRRVLSRKAGYSYSNDEVRRLTKGTKLEIIVE